jgi:RNA polymerase primary sigma factor/RNA polymerase sigma factor
VDRFIRQNQKRVRHGAEFSRLTDAQREQMIDRGRRLARAGANLAEVTKRLARRTGRSTETVRCVLRQFDRDHPEAAIFPEHNGPLREKTNEEIFQQFRRGDSVEALAKQFSRTKASVRRVIAKRRFRQLSELPLDYVPNEGFERVKSEKSILAPAPRSDQPTPNFHRSRDLPSHMARLCETPLLTSAQEVHLFRKMNYLKYKASKLFRRLDPVRPNAHLMDRIEKLYGESVATRNAIIRANLRLVVSLAKRQLQPAEDFFELVSDGTMSLMRAVDKFDFARGNKFSTYATWAITKNFARSIPKELRHQNRFRTSHAETLGSTEDNRGYQSGLETATRHRENQVRGILERLDEREQNVIIRRFGLAGAQEPLTLKAVGATLGVTKERVRQIEARALKKLREATHAEGIELAEA